jgi:hypothetical protein
MGGLSGTGRSRTKLFGAGVDVLADLQVLDERLVAIVAPLPVPSPATARIVAYDLAGVHPAFAGWIPPRGSPMGRFRAR